jgi:hypothetical protein
VDSSTRDIRLSKDLLDFVSSMFGFGEDDCTLDLGITKEMEEEISLVLFGYGI